MCASVQFTLSIQSVRLDLYTCYRITRVLLIFCYFQVFVFFSWAHSIYFGTGNRETKVKDLTSFHKDLRFDRHQSFVRLFVPKVVCNRVLSCLLLYSLSAGNTQRGYAGYAAIDFFKKGLQSTWNVGVLWSCCSVLRLSQVSTRHPPSRVSSCFTLQMHLQQSAEAMDKIVYAQ